MSSRPNLAAALALAVAVPSFAAAQEAKGAKPLPTTFLASPNSPLVAIRVLVPAGSQYDPPGKEGLAALTAAMVAEGGSKDLSYDEVLQQFYPMAAALDGACRKEVAVFSGVIHRDNLVHYADIAATMIATPRFAPEDFERLRSQSLDALTKSLRGNNDEELGKQVMQLAIYGADHPYGHVDVGTVAGLKAITLDDVKAFHKAHYGRAGMRIGVAGGPDETFPGKLAEALAAGGGATAPAPKLPAVAAPDGLHATIVTKPAEATAISIGFPIDVTRADDDFYALFLANSYLGEHRTFNGQLMQHLRRDRGLNYGDYSYAEEFLQEGGSNLPVPNNPRRQQYFSIWVRPVPHDKAAFALRAALYEFDKLATNGMTPEAFEATRDFLLNYSNLYTQTLDRRLGYVLEGDVYGRHSLVDELQARLPKMTVEQVNAAIKKHLRPKGLYVAIVTRDGEALAKLLSSDAPTPLTYDTEGTPESILGEDKVIERFPLEDLRTTIVPASALFEAPGLPTAR